MPTTHKILLLTESDQRGKSHDCSEPATDSRPGAL